MKKYAISLFTFTTLVAVAGCAAETDAPGATPPEEATAGEAQAWGAASATSEAASTHLWIVDRAIDLLAKRSDLPRATAIVNVMNAPACRAQWQQGLLDADYLAQYNNGSSDTTPSSSTAALVGSGATWESHFYDPDTEKNYKGATSPTARTEAAKHLGNAQSGFAANDTHDACYELGLSLHYMTDSTQPMHASNFTNVSRAAKLHGNVEAYAEQIQDRYRLTDAGALVTNATPDAALVAGAHTAKGYWPPLLQAIYNAYKSRTWTCYAAYSAWLVDDSACWKNDAEVDRQIGISLQAAQTSTATYLYAVSAVIQ